MVKKMVQDNEVMDHSFSMCELSMTNETTHTASFNITDPSCLVQSIIMYDVNHEL